MNMAHVDFCTVDNILVGDEDAKCFRKYGIEIYCIYLPGNGGTELRPIDSHTYRIAVRSFWLRLAENSGNANSRHKH